MVEENDIELSLTEPTIIPKIKSDVLVFNSFIVVYVFIPFFINSSLAVEDSSTAVISFIPICSIKEPVPEPISIIFFKLLLEFIQFRMIFPKYFETSGDVKKSPSLSDLTISVLKKPSCEYKASSIKVSKYINSVSYFSFMYERKFFFGKS